MVKQKEKRSAYETLKTNDLIPYARNARKHSEKQVNQIAGSIKEFGFINPVIVDSDNGIIAGHGRVLAAQKLGLETVPCLRVEHLTETQKKAYILADNKLALNSEWDDELLALEIEELKEFDFDLDIIGFDSFVTEEFEPTFRQENEADSAKPTEYILTVSFENNDEMQLLFCELRDRGLKVKAR